MAIVVTSSYDNSNNNAANNNNNNNSNNNSNNNNSSTGTIDRNSRANIMIMLMTHEAIRIANVLTVISRKYVNSITQ